MSKKSERKKIKVINIKNEKIDVMNIETLLMPVSLDVACGRADFEEHIGFFQVIRVWYKINHE